MNLFLVFIFIFFIGSTLGWVIELIYRRIAHKKWVNPGFLVGPYLPIYGFGLVAVTYIHLLFYGLNLPPVLAILLMGVTMTIIELVGGLISLYNNVRLWDYSDRWLNYKGIICPLFSVVWTIVGAIYYYFLASPVLYMINWFSKNLSFSFVLGLFTGVLIIDFIYSTNLYIKINKFAKENEILIKYEKLKMQIKEAQEQAKEKYFFLTPFRQTKSLRDYIMEYIENNKRK